MSNEKTPLNEEQLNETYRSLVQLFSQGMKLSAFLNGGASVALLSYLGSIASSTSTRPIPDMRWAMGIFVFGLFSCELALFFGYMTQLRIHEDAASLPPTISKYTWQSWMRAAAISSIISVLCFGTGAFFAVTRFQIGPVG